MDELENELRNKILIIRLDVQEEVGRELALVYDFKFTPTFIFFDGEGNEIWREVGSLNPQRVKDTLE